MSHPAIVRDVLFEQWSLGERLDVDDEGYIIMSYLRHGNSDLQLQS